LRRTRTAALLTVACLAALVVGGCRVPQVASIAGSGVSATERRDVSGFVRLQADGFGDIVIVTGEGEYVVVEGDDNIVPDVETVVRGGTLSIGLSRGNYDPELPLTITVGIDELEGIDVSGAVDLKAGTLRGNTFLFRVSGAASAEVEYIDVASLRAEVSGAGDCFVRGGNAGSQMISVSGAGTYDAPDLDSATAEAEVSGAGDIAVRVSDTLDASASGAGTVVYHGSPDVREHTSGAGSVVRAR